MGCCSSVSSEFRDIYAEMLKTFQLIPSSSDFTTKPKQENIGKRTKAFETVGAKGKTAPPRGNKNPFECYPTEVKLPLLTNKSEVIWKLSSIHPYNGLLTKETVISLCFVRSIKSYEEALKAGPGKRTPIRKGNQWNLFRWDFRLWMLGMCEFYHAVALLVESKSVPSKATRWFAKMQFKDRHFFRLNENGDLSPEARKAIEESDELRIAQKDITTKLLKSINKEMPSVFNSKSGPGPKSVQMTAGGIFDAASEYWKEKKEALKAYAPGSSLVTAQKAKKGEKESIPLIALVEWMTLRYVRSMCGEEERELNYLPVLHDEDQEFPPVQRNMLNIDDDDCTETPPVSLHEGDDVELEGDVKKTETEPHDPLYNELSEAEIIKAQQRAECEQEEAEGRGKLEEEFRKQRELIEIEFNRDKAQELQLLMDQLCLEEEAERKAIEDDENGEVEGVKRINDNVHEEEVQKRQRAASVAHEGTEQADRKEIEDEEEAERKALLDEFEKLLRDAQDRAAALELLVERIAELVGEEEEVRKVIEDDGDDLFKNLRKASNDIVENEKIAEEIVQRHRAASVAHENTEEADRKEIEDEEETERKALLDAFKTLLKETQETEDRAAALELLKEHTATLAAEEENARRSIEEEEQTEWNNLDALCRCVVAMDRLLVKEMVERATIRKDELDEREDWIIAAMRNTDDIIEKEKAKECHGDLDVWRKIIRRLDMVDKLMEDENMSSEEKNGLASEKQQLMDNLESLFKRLNQNTGELTKEQCRDGLYDELQLETLFPDRAPCDATSDQAFKVTTESTGDEVIGSLGLFRNFMRTYIALIDLYGDTAEAEGKQLGDGIDALDEEVNTVVLLKAYERGDFMDDLPFPDEVTTLEEKINTIWKYGTHECPDEINRIEFDDLVAILTENMPELTGKYTLRNLKELKASIGADGNAAKQQEYMQRVVEALPEELKTALAEGKTIELEEEAEHRNKCADALDSEAKLKFYSRFHPSAAELGLAFCTQALYCPVDTNPLTHYLQTVKEAQAEEGGQDGEGESKRAIIPFTSKAVFTTTAVLRGFEDNRHDEAGPLTFEEWESPVSFEWFDKALTDASRALDLSKDELASHSLKYLRARQMKGGYAPESEEEAAIQPMMQKAYHLLDRNGREAGVEGGVRVRDVVNMCLYAQLENEFRDEPLFEDFFQHAFEDLYILPKDRRSTKLAAYKTPADAAKKLHEIFFGRRDQLDLYTEFFSLSRGCRSIPMSVEETVAVEGEGKMNVEVFVENFKAKYMEEIEPFLVKTESSMLFQEAAAYITTDVPFTARRYRDFLTYICGAAMTTSMFAIHHMKETDRLQPDAFLAYPVSKPFVQLMVEQTDREFQSTGEETPDAIYDEALTTAEGEAPTVSRTVDWYSSYRVERLPPTLYDRWEVLAPTLPYSASAEHREQRRPLLAAMHKRSVALTKEKNGNEDGCEDRYFPIRAVAEVLFETYDMGLVVHALRDSAAHRQTAAEEASKKSGAAPSPSSSAALRVVGAKEVEAELLDGVPALEVFTRWFEEHVVGKVNAGCGRPDLGQEELHWTGVRFALQYIHHCVEAFFLSEETCKEVEAMIRADVGPSGRPANLTSFMKKKGPQYCTYLDAEHVSTTEKAVHQVWGPDEEVASVHAAMLALANPALVAEEKQASITRDNSALVNPETVGHVIATRLTDFTIGAFHQALQAYKESLEDQFAAAFEEKWLSGKSMKEAAAAMSKMASYWERLRFLLPHKHNEKHRLRRRRVYELMDRKGKGYLHVPDINFGNTEVLHMYQFREDTAPVLFRAFFAVKEQAFAREDVVYLTGGAEQLITPPEFCAYLDYFYQYMELYFMFDVLCSAGRVMNDLHVKPDAPVNTEACLHVLPAMQRVDNTGRQYTPASALRAAADDPYQLSMEATKTSKVVNLHQFRLAKYLLRHWGMTVRDPAEEFKKMNRRCGEYGELQFTDFAIWASKHQLHPDGYGHRVDENSAELASLEEGLLAQHCSRLRELLEEKRALEQPPDKDGEAMEDMIVTDLL